MCQCLLPVVSVNADGMLKKIAPFLVYDQDPYLVLTEEGRMKWIYDAYTISNEFPYSEPFNARINYIRNSVKVVIDVVSVRVKLNQSLSFIIKE